MVLDRVLEPARAHHQFQARSVPARARRARASPDPGTRAGLRNTRRMSRSQKYFFTGFFRRIPRAICRGRHSREHFLDRFMPPAAVRPSSRHRFPVVLATLTVLLSGFFALGRLPIDLLPAHEAPRLLVRVSVPGVSASAIEE